MSCIEMNLFTNLILFVSSFQQNNVLKSKWTGSIRSLGLTDRDFGLKTSILQRDRSEILKPNYRTGQRRHFGRVAKESANPKRREYIVQRLPR